MPTQRPSLGLAPALPGIVLVVVIAWALAAVLMLTGTLLNAREIDDDVTVINSQVSPIEKDLQYVALAAETVRISADINTAAQPLSGQATQILAAANRINTTARSILTTAGSINQTAHQINNTVTQIHGTVISIAGAVQGIGADVGSIFGLVQSIGGHVASIHALVGRQNSTDPRSINNTVSRIQETFVTLEPIVVSIDRAGNTGGVAAINGRADRAIALAQGIKSDFDQILATVGEINKHANSIDCSKLINFGGPTQSCNR